MTYVDGFVAAVPTANKAEYIEHATAAAAIFKEHGALRLVECWGDDVPDETVVFSWILWPARETRNAAMEKIMADERLDPQRNPMPFDGMRLIYGGFEMIVDA